MFALNKHSTKELQLLAGDFIPGPDPAGACFWTLYRNKAFSIYVSMQTRFWTPADPEKIIGNLYLTISW